MFLGQLWFGGDWISSPSYRSRCCIFCCAFFCLMGICGNWAFGCCDVVCNSCIVVCRSRFALRSVINIVLGSVLREFGYAGLVMSRLDLTCWFVFLNFIKRGFMFNFLYAGVRKYLNDVHCMLWTIFLHFFRVISKILGCFTLISMWWFLPLLENMFEFSLCPQIELCIYFGGWNCYFFQLGHFSVVFEI